MVLGAECATHSVFERQDMPEFGLRAIITMRKLETINQISTLFKNTCLAQFEVIGMAEFQPCRGFGNG
jgi:hypothetical protein